jgi:predicted outer membrane repeat protein
VVTNCIFTDNIAEWGGGAISNYDLSNSVITNCTFSDNSSVYGGAIYNGGSTSDITSCTFIGNSAGSWMWPGSGGAICNHDSSPAITNCTFISNVAEWWGGVSYGGAMYNASSNPIITNCVFSSNYSAYEGYGGAMYNHDSNSAITNCTFSGNMAEELGGAMYNDGGNPAITNCILWGNEPDEIYVSSGSPLVNYSTIQGGWAGSGNNNIAVDPCFANVDANDFHLKSQAGRWNPNTQSWVQDDVTSACIDTGDMANPVGLEPFPNGGVINMGAYGGTAETSKSYFGTVPCETIVAGDINGDCKVDFKDFALIAYHWLEDNNP